MADPPEFDIGPFPREELMTALRVFGKRDDGQDLLEYAMLASLIAIFALAAVGALATQINDVFWGALATLDF